MGALFNLMVVQAGRCIVTPAQVGLVTEVSVALLLLQQPEAGRRDECTCHAADFRPTHRESRIFITDCEGEQHVFSVMTGVLREMLKQQLLYESGDGISCTQLQGTILKPTSKGNARAAMIRRFGRY